MHPHVRHRLTNSIQYHEALAEHYGERHKKASAPPLAAESSNEEDGTSRRTARPGTQPENGSDKAKSAAASGDGEKEEQAAELPKSPDQQLAETHADAAQQLRNLLEATPPTPVIYAEWASQAIRRDNRPMPATRVH